MSDFLSSLAARALPNAIAALPLLQPRLRARFEPPDLSGALLEQFESENTVATPTAVPPHAPVVASVPLRVPDAAQPSQVASLQPPTQPMSEFEPIEQFAPAQGEQPIAMPEAVRVTNAQTAASDVLREANAAVDLPPTSTQAPTALVARGEASAPQQAAPPTAQSPQRPASAPIPVTTVRAPQSAPPAALEQEAAPAPEPLIQVTIGRIEVRASTPAAAPRGRPASEGSSLAEYLRKGDKR